MNDTWNPTQQCETNVDQQIAIASGFQEDGDRRKEEGPEDLATVHNRNVSHLE
jgi:hypothetical protein